MSTATVPDTLFTTAGLAPAGGDGTTGAVTSAGGDGTTLDDRVVAILEDLAVRGRARCLVCGGETAPTGQCRACAATLT